VELVSQLRITRDHLESTVGKRFEAIAEAQPEALALVSHGKAFTYAELNKAANGVAWLVLNRVGEGEIPVLLDSIAGERLLIAILGLCKAGKPFTAVTRDMSGELRDSIRKDLNPGLVLDREQLESCAGDDRNPNPGFGPERAASIVYTSGSTAAPKGVVRTHGNLLHRAWIYNGDSGVGPGDIQALMAPLSHVGAESDLFGAWMNGASVSHHPASLGVAGMTEWLINEKVSLWHPPVGLLRRWLSLVENPVELPSLRLVALGGETIYWSDIRAIREMCRKHVRVLHRYSSSEAGNITSYQVADELGPDDEPVPVGFPCADKSVGVSAEGHVTVKSRFISRGYWNGRAFDGEFATGDVGRFDSNGCLQLDGRADRRVKVRGFLVDLAELEGILLAEKGVREAAVVADGDRLLAYTVKAPADLKERVSGKLAPWMRPDAYIAVDRMPLTSTGKIDRRALPLPPARGTAPQAGLEEHLTELWRTVLGRPDAGADDNFFELGGDSLRAAELMIRVSRLVNSELPASALYWAPSPAELRVAIEQDQIGSGGMVPLASGTGEPWFLAPPPPKGTMYYRELPKLIGTPVFGYDIEYSREQIHDVARRIASELNARWPERKWNLAGFSFGGNLAFELARIMGDRVSTLVLIDCNAPGFITGREIDHGIVGNRLAVWRHMLNCWRFEVRTFFRLRGTARWAFVESALKVFLEKFRWRFIFRKAFIEAPAPEGKGVRHHKTGVYEGPVHIIRFSNPYPGTPLNPFLGWERWAGGKLTSETIQGIHLPLMFRSPWAESLAAALQRARIAELEKSTNNMDGARVSVRKS
jgi:acyl-CoA synthetase (AMP-forming)/AMP-acid ligase II/pimeloyl-ACP methyl ester carboxylesterase